MPSKPFSLAIHGGAGTILRSEMSASKEAKYQKALLKSITKGYQILEKGGSALDAVETCVMCLEDIPLFNAGRGSVFNSRGQQEMDASIMDGQSLKAGAVAMVRHIKNPVHLARCIMEHSNHVFLAGKGAEKFAKSQGFKRINAEYFFNEERYKQLLVARKEDRILLDHNKYGTVGAVALDTKGHLAAATSTGGMTNKKFGRIGDSPVIGAGCYADDHSCAVSCTGSGEYFLRTNAAFHVSALMRYGGQNLIHAANQIIHELLPSIGGDGGLIAIDTKGNIALPFNTEGMYRAYQKAGKPPVIEIYK